MKNKWEEKENISQKKNKNKQIEKNPEDSMKEIRIELIWKQKTDILKKIKNKSGIYSLTNILNDIKYIGSSTNIRDRFYVHINKLRKNSHTSVKLQNAWNKYGEESFIFEIIEIVENKELLIEREQYYLNTLLFASENDNRFNELGYNIRRIADSNIGFKKSDEAIQKTRNKNLGQKRTDEFRKYLSDINKGKKHSEETKEKLRIVNTNKQHSESTKLKISILTKGENNPFYGKTHTEETKKIIREKLKNRKQSQETINKRIKSSYGKKWKKVYQYDLGGNFIQEWESVTKAQNELKIGHISSVCLNKRNHAGGFIWKYSL